MINIPPSHIRRSGLRLVSQARALLAVSVLAALAVSSRSLALTLPPPVDLGAVGVSAVAQGYVVGSSNSSAYVWTSTSGMRDLGALLPSAPADAISVYSGAIAVNSHGEVVLGRSVTRYVSATDSYTFSSTAYYWSQATGIVTIGTTGNFSQYPFFINESGVVAGLDDQ